MERRLSQIEIDFFFLFLFLSSHRSRARDGSIGFDIALQDIDDGPRSYCPARIAFTSSRAYYNTYVHTKALTNSHKGIPREPVSYTSDVNRDGIISFSIDMPTIELNGQSYNKRARASVYTRSYCRERCPIWFYVSADIFLLKRRRVSRRFDIMLLPSERAICARWTNELRNTIGHRIYSKSEIDANVAKK